jgi:cytochrome c
MRITAFSAAVVLLTACETEHPPQFEVQGGHPDAGRLVLEQYGCGACHVIPGVRGALGEVGPPLDQFSRRTYVAGIYPNHPDNLVRFIIDPPAMAPGTAMPALGVTEAHARDAAAYLYQLK